MERTTCAIVGGGPAGMVLGLLLARAGVDVTVLEKHGDFLRDFRGDTVHASTIRLLDELGLGREFRKLPHSELRTVGIPGPDGTQVLGDLNRLRAPYNYIAMVPQWDFLDLLADASKQEPTYTLRINTEVVGVLREGKKVVGVRYRTSDGVDGELRADLTVACDGRHSLLRAESGLRPETFPVPMDVWWFRLPKDQGTATGLQFAMRAHEFLLQIDRGDYWQMAYIAKKGMDAQLRAEGVAKFRDRVVGIMPVLADRIDALTSMADVKVLDVQLDRLHKWHIDGLLCIGDAAHAMSPIGGVGINLAVQDAVAAAVLLAQPLKEGRVREADLAKVRRRRWMPMVVIQGLQRFLHSKLMTPVLTGQRADYPAAPLVLTKLFPPIRAIPAYIVAIGPRPEHAPEFARR
ncbi:FAD-dependent oxidoreductase [Actinocrispum wychmicini]|uniref:2-polyprenyl-6-methoxyphenol hydroxylase-like FAD-dependent oxidoreductase n=1 Tax=Actinocrispum wychmicini TaxID=1213861 RepID=A0A4R2JC05_9PSEU|nr:FAD-dependent oxidoreductase [Actinocrispum wychmicini]TCO57051.1 2-polyprenyl-6-methoxyphenol hydroxylase-like FAD-dependent oxidoreductase [Actinocrispum wychmicini]